MSNLANLVDASYWKEPSLHYKLHGSCPTSNDHTRTRQPKCEPSSRGFRDDSVLESTSKAWKRTSRRLTDTHNNKNVGNIYRTLLQMHALSFIMYPHSTVQPQHVESNKKKKSFWPFKPKMLADKSSLTWGFLQSRMKNVQITNHKFGRNMK